MPLTCDIRRRKRPHSPAAMQQRPQARAAAADFYIGIGIGVALLGFSIVSERLSVVVCELRRQVTRVWRGSFARSALLGHANPLRQCVFGTEMRSAWLCTYMLRLPPPDFAMWHVAASQYRSKHCNSSDEQLIIYIYALV